MYNDDYSEFDDKMSDELDDESYYGYREQKKIEKARKRKRKATSFIMIILSTLIFLSSISLFSIIMSIKNDKSKSQQNNQISIENENNSENIIIEQNEPTVNEPQQNVAEADVIKTEYPNDGQYRYFRNKLPEDQKKIYDEILMGIRNMDDAITIYSNDFNEIEKMVTFIYADNPDCFWYDCTVEFEIYSYEFYKEIIIKPKYTMDKSAAELYWVTVNDYISSIKSETEGMDEYQKVKYVYENIIKNTKYDLEYKDNTCISVISNGRGVCSGYSATMQLVLNKLEIPTILCMGKSKGEPHAWNMVLLNNGWYHIDTTFGDPISADGINWITYEYFIVNDEKIMQDHEYDQDLIYPECTGTLEEKENDFWGLIEHIT